MVIQERLLDVDAVLDLTRQPEFADKRFYIIDGELFEMSPVQWQHGSIAVHISSLIWNYIQGRNLGGVSTEVGFYAPGDRSTLLAPDVAFVSQARLRHQPEDSFLSIMPDLAVEIASPSNSLAQLRRKAAIYLNNGSSLVWLVRPADAGVEVWRAADDGRLFSEFIGAGTLSGEAALPGFTLELARLFPPPAQS